MIDNTFIALASNILGDTDSGLSGREICEYLAEYAVEYNVLYHMLLILIRIFLIKELH